MSFAVAPSLPRRLRMSRPRRVPMVRQMTAAECGLAALAMTLAYFGRHVPREELRELLVPTRDGLTARAILTAATECGLEGKALRMELRHLADVEAGSILHWGLNHFVVLERVAPRGLRVVDPAIGRRWIEHQECERMFTGVVLVFRPSPTFEPRPVEPSWHRFRRIVRTLMASGPWGRILTASLALQLVMLAVPLLTGRMVDWLGVHRHVGLFPSFLAVACIAALQIFFLLFVRAHLLVVLRARFESALSIDLVEHMMALPLSFFRQRSAGDLSMRLGSSAVIREVLTSAALSAVLDGTLIFVYLGALTRSWPKLALLIVALCALQCGLFAFARPHLRDLDALAVDRRSRHEAVQYEMLAGIETLKAMGVEDEARARWARRYVDMLNVAARTGRFNALIEALHSALRLGAPMVVVAVGCYAVMEGRASLGALMSLSAMTAGIFTPLAHLITTGVEFERLGAYVDRLEDVHRAARERSGSARKAPPLSGAIRLEDVSFRYTANGPAIVNDVSLSIRPGELVAIVGPSGAGKSTLAALLLGLYEPTKGTVRYDGLALSELDIHSVRRQFGIVTQGAYVFAGTIRDNIALAAPELPLDRVIAAAKAAHIHDEIERMPMRYDTILTDGGGSISGGQRQRLALARALVRRPAVLFLDEATSAIDNVVEREIQRSLAQIRCTRVVIAHRLSTVVDADRILVMRDGTIVEQGTHAELLARGGAYAELAGELGSKGPRASSVAPIAKQEDP